MYLELTSFSFMLQFSALWRHLTHVSQVWTLHCMPSWAGLADIGSNRSKIEKVNNKKGGQFFFKAMASTPKRPAPPPPVPNEALLKQYFDRVDLNSNGLISADELKSALTNGNEDYPFQLSTVKTMLDAFKWVPISNELLVNYLRIGIFRYESEINFQQFGNIWRYVNDWQRCFRKFDKDKSGSINGQELYTALTSFGYQISSQMANLLVRRFDRKGDGEILFDDFIKTCLILHGLTKEFQVKDSHQTGNIQVSYEDFLEMVLSCSSLFL